jgi:hypothetical protein
MCIDITNFITDESKLKDFICPIGKGIIIDPVYLNCTSTKTIHVFCKECFDNYEQSKPYYYRSCPICSSPYNKIEIVPYYQDIINTLEIKCEAEFCTWEGTVDKYRIHRSSCENRIVTCPNDPCGSKMKYIMLEQHVNVCDFAKLDCVTCQSKYIRKNASAHVEMLKCTDCENEYNKCIFSKHQSLCEHRPVICRSCRQTYKYKDETLHKNNECPERYIQCEHCNSAFQFKRRAEEDYKHHQEHNSCDYCKKEIQNCLKNHHLANTCELAPIECEICMESYTKLNMTKHMNEKIGEHLLMIYRQMNLNVDAIKTKNDKVCEIISSKINDLDRKMVNMDDQITKVKNQLKKLSEHLNVTYESD